jgi:uroporphyrinogen-III decarboxylase
MNKTTEELYKEREKRVNDAVQLKTPDRVPVMMELSYFPAKYAGLTFEAAWYDYEGWLEANRKAVRDFEPDLVHITPFFPGKILEYLDPKPLRWPGHGVSPNHSHQYLELENMKADDYDAFLGDTTDYILRVHLPRVCGAMEPFQMLPQLSSLGYSYRGALTLAEALVKPEVAAAIETLQKVGRELEKWRSRMDSFGDEIEKLGFPRYSPGTAQAPFDAISDFLRGMHGAMLDMYRQPDKLLEACDKISQGTLERITTTAAGEKSSNTRLLFMGMHRGSDGFMSLKQFETFYWPTLKKVILAVADTGLVPCLFYEGDWTARLEYLLELPGGKTVGRFDRTDIFKAKQILNGHTCIMGNVPSSLLQAGTPAEVRDYCKKLIDVVGKDGGFIMSAGSSIDEAEPENLKAMVDFTREYGVYS